MLATRRQSLEGLWLATLQKCDYLMRSGSVLERKIEA